MSWMIRHRAAPVAPPITMPGPKTPPEPPEPIDSVVATILAKGITSTNHSGADSIQPLVICSWVHP